MEFSKHKIIFKNRAFGHYSAMPKPSGKMTDAERAIARRVRQVRFDNQLSKPAFARKVGVTPDRIAGIEYCRTPLIVSIADKICSRFDVSLLWLAHGRGSVKPCFGLVSQLRPEINGSELLSKAVTKELVERAAFKASYDHFAVTSILTGDAIPLTEKGANTFLPNFHQEFDALFSTLPDDGKSKLLALVIRTLSSFEVDWESGNHATPGENITMRLQPPKKDLTNASEFRNMSADMKLPRTMDQLLADVRRLTTSAGMKAALAKYLEVPHARVSEWLAGKYKPSGEVTLKLMRWVSDPHERQQK